MNKLNELRTHLLQSVPGLHQNPDKLLTFVEDGQIEFHRGPNLSHSYRIPARIIITDYSRSMDEIIIPLLMWLRRWQPDLDPAEAVQFEAEILSNHAYDLILTVQLTETVHARWDCEAGQVHVEHRMPDFAIEDCPAQSWELYVRDPDSEDYDLVSQWESPSDNE